MSEDDRKPTGADDPEIRREALRSFCPQCGPDVAYDEDGCCDQCGDTCVGAAVDAFVTEREILREALRRMHLRSQRARGTRTDEELSDELAAGCLLGHVLSTEEGVAAAERGLASIRAAVAERRGKVKP
jgi:hypothetical protein